MTRGFTRGAVSVQAIYTYEGTVDVNRCAAACLPACQPAFEGHVHHGTGGHVPCSVLASFDLRCNDGKEYEVLLSHGAETCSVV